VSEFDIEPVPGLPEELPEGEFLRWQGAPKWGALAVRALHVRTVAVYFGALIALRIGYMLFAGEPAKVALLSGLWLVLLCLAAISILTVTGYALARSTIYSITNRRVVIRFGVALPMAVNIPFKAVQSAGLRRYADGVGDIPMVLADEHRVSYLILWPNVRPWRILNAQPMLRCVPEVDRVAEILADALRAATAAEQGATPSTSAHNDRADAAGNGASQLDTAPATGR
jgi:hypothetical protein